MYLQPTDPDGSRRNGLWCIQDVPGEAIDAVDIERALVDFPVEYMVSIGGNIHLVPYGELEQLGTDIHSGRIEIDKIGRAHV